MDFGSCPETWGSEEGRRQEAEGRRFALAVWASNPH